MVKQKKNAKKIKKPASYKEIFRKYLNGEIKLETYQKVGILMLIWVIAGVIGWVYEFIVGWIENGEPYMVGGNLLPWINIYAFGAMALIPATWKLRKYPWAVFLTAVLVTGAVELLGGWLVYMIGDGTRYWNYDHGLWLVGSINGFVCLLSVTIFGLFALALMYLVLPFCIYLAVKMSRRAFLTLSIALFSVFMVDELTNLVLKNLGEPTAMDLYRSLGAKYQSF